MQTYKKSLFYSLFFFTTICFHFGDSSMIVSSPEALAGEYISVGYVFVGDTSDWNISGQLVFADPHYPCDVEDVTNAADLVGNIVVTQAGKCSPATQAKTVKALGAIAMLVLISQQNSLPSGFAAWSKDDGVGLEHFPMADLVPKKRYKDVHDTLTEKTPILVIVTPDPNYVADESIWTPYTIFIGGFALVNVVLATRKLYQFVQFMGPKLVLSQIVLGIEVFANSMRVVHSLQPSAGGRGLWSSVGQGMIFTFSWPYSFIATMMIAFYWEETLMKFSTKAGLSRETWTSLSKMRIPAIVVSVLLVVFEHTFAALRASGATTVDFSVYVVSVLYLVIALVVGLYFAITGCRIVMFLRKTVKTSGSSTKIIQKMSLLLSVSGMGLLFYVLGNIITASTITTGTVNTFAVALGIMYTGLNISSFTQILVFTSPNEDNSLSSKTPKTSDTLELKNSTTTAASTSV